MDALNWTLGTSSNNRSSLALTKILPRPCFPGVPLLPNLVMHRAIISLLTLVSYPVETQIEGRSDTAGEG